MNKQIWPHLGAASGILYVVLILVGDSLFVEGGNRAGIVVEMVGLLFFILFLAYLFSVLRSAEGEDGWLSITALGAGLAGVTMRLGNAALGIAVSKGGMTTDIAEALTSVNSASFMLTMLPLGIMVAAVATLVLQKRALPMWTGWISAIVAIALLVNGTFLDAEFRPAFLLFLPWTLLTSGVLLWRLHKANARIPAAPNSAR